MIDPNVRQTQGPERASEPPDVTAAYPTGGAGEELVHVLDQYLSDLEAGRAPSREKLLAEHPALASQLEPCLSGIEFIHRAAGHAADAPSQLGDFEIVGEVGRGGMGVVYEARQLSLKRKVALKVLRFAGVADRDAMERFQREGETVAQLHHTNIVPIFAIGEQKGVFYYAMQFIEGHSLAAVLEQSQKEAASLDLAEVARWTLQAAEALAHAHQRGVIHRDVKPSNLILDPAGQIWLTDFGLAKRMDDPALSMTGALLGTPRYMSPEQASAAKQPVDQRTDIYSLGATLYELATGKPLFEADSPHGIISQILTTEPPAPRSLRTSLPRDLETIILKCLAKEPHSRYATAQALADDLRAFCEGRPIKARRASLPERAARWARKNRRNVVLAASAAAIGMLLLAGGIMISSKHYESQLGRLQLKTDGPSLVAEVLEADHDYTVMPSFTVPTAEPVALPAGSYRVRLSSPGRATETTQLLMDRGNQLDYTVGLKQQLLWDPVSLSSHDTARVVNLKASGWFHLIRSQDWHTLSLLFGYTGKSTWEWSSSGDLSGRSLTYDRNQDPPELVQPGPDLEHSGVGAVVWACRSSAALWALSGSAFGNTGADIQGKGKELWWFSNGPGETLGVPAVADVDGDGTPDFIATFAANGNVWVEAVSGKTGKSLWRFPLPGKWDRDGVRSRFAAEVVQLQGRSTVICAAGTQLVGLNLNTGKPTWPAFDLGMEPIVQPQVADLDRDGTPDLLMVGLGPPNTLSVRVLSLATQKPIWTKALFTQIPPDQWNWGWPEGRGIGALRAWPWVADLGGNGKPAVIVPIIPACGTNRFQRWGGVEMLDGATGEPQWQHRLKLNENILCCDRLLVGPDIDDDGRRELFAASTACYRSWQQAVFVDALSGKDGRSLWWWRSEATGYGNSGGGSSSGSDGFSSYNSFTPSYQATALRLWSTGPDGWPQIVVPYNNDETAVLSTGTGRLQRKISDHGLVEVGDLNGDGIDDLVFRTRWPEKLFVIRGTPPELWRRLGDWQPAEDFDGDGIPDLLNTSAYRSLNDTAAISGRNGQVLWRSSNSLRKHVPLPRDHNDLDGDGTPDFLTLEEGGFQTRIDGTPGGVRVPLNLRAISGRTGKQIWSAEDIVVEPEKGQTSELVGFGAAPQVVACRDLDGDGKWEVVLFYDLVTGNHNAHQLWLASFTLHDGKFLWRQALSERMNDTNLPNDLTYQPAIDDLDGDEILDLVIAVPLPPEKSGSGIWSSELRAISGREGKLIWRRPLAVQVEAYNLKKAASVPVIGRLGNKAEPQVVVLTQSWRWPDGKNAAAASIVAEVLSYAGRTGELIWRHPQKFLNTNFFQPSVLLADTMGDGKFQIYASVGSQFDYGGFKINGIVHPDDGVLLDAIGQVQPGLEIPIGGIYDLDGDGKDELLQLGNGKLTVTRGGVKTIMWERSEVGGIRNILPGKPGKPSTVVVTSSESVLGLDGATGKPLWRCSSQSADSLLPVSDPREPPWLISHTDGSTVCRRAQPATADGEYAPAVGTPRTDAPLPDDPRIVRQLPWIRESSSDPDGPGGRSLATGRIPQWIFLLSLLFCTVRRRWWSVAAELALFLVSTLVVGILFLWDDSHVMDPMEHYSWNGWYQVVYFGMFAAGAIVGLLFIAWLAWRMGRWAVGRTLVRART